MKRTTMFLDEALEKELQVLARQRGLPVAALVREALATYVAQAQEALTLSFVGAGASGRSDVAERHEELLWRDPHGEEAAPRRRRPRPRTKRR
jgi:predicted transcriptional regulator